MQVLNNLESMAVIRAKINSNLAAIDALGGFTFDAVNNRFIWDSVNNFDMPIIVQFVGSAGLQVTANLGGGVLVTLGLFVNGNLILETPLNFTVLSRIKGYSANDLLIDDTTKLPILNQGSYIEVFAKADTGETPTMALDFFNITIGNR